MANRYWVGGTGTWDATTTHWSTTSGGSAGASVPGASDVAIFDSNSNVAGSGASYTVTFTNGGSVTGIQLDNPSAGTLTFAGSANVTVSTSGFTTSSTVNCTYTGTITYGSSGLLSTNGNIINSPIVVNSALVTLGSTSKTSSSFTFTNGGFSSRLATAGFDLYCNTFVSSASGAITPSFDFTSGGTIYITSTSTATVINNAFGTFNATGTVNFTLNGAAGSGITRTVTAGTSRFNLNVAAGSDTVVVSGSLNNMDLTGYSGTFSASSTNIAGNFTVPSTVTAVTGTVVLSGGFVSPAVISIIGICTAAVSCNTNTFTLSSIAGMTSATTFTQTSGTVTTAGAISTSAAYTLTAGTLTLAGNMTTPGAFTYTAGTLNLNGNILTALTFTSSGSTTRTIAFGTGSINLTATTATTVINFVGTNVSYTGTPNINLTGNAANAIVRTITVSGFTVTNAVNINITGGSSGNIIRATTPLTVNNLDFSSSLVSYLDIGTNNVAATIYGNLIMPSNHTGSASASITMAATSTGKQIKGNSSVAFNTSGTNLGGGLYAGLTFNGIGGEWILQDNFTSNGSISVVTLTAGTLNLNNFTFPLQTFSSSGTGVRAINFGTSGQLQIWKPGALATVTVWNTATTTNMTILGTPKVVLKYGNSSGDNNITISAGTITSNPVGFYFLFDNGGMLAPSGHTNTLTITGNVGTLDFTGLPTPLSFASSTNINIYGSLKLTSNVYASTSAGGSGSAFWPAVSSVTLNFKATTTGNTITTAAANFTALNTVVFDGVGGEWILQDNFTGNNNVALTLTNGTLNLNNKSFPIQSFTSNNSNTRSINFGTSGSMGMFIAGTATAWNTATVTGLTYQGIPTLKFYRYSAASTTITLGSITSNQPNLYFLTGTAGATTVAITGNAGSIDSSGITASGLTINASSGLNLYGGMVLNSFTTLGSSMTINFLSPNAGQTINANGATVSSVVAMNFSSTGGWIFNSAFSAASAVITHTGGSLNLNGFNVTASSYTASGSSAITLKLGSSTLTLSAAIPWNITGSSVSITPGTSTISCSNATVTFNGNNLSYYNLTFSNTSGTSVTLNGSNSFNNVTLTGTLLTAVNFTGANTYSGSLTFAALTTAAYTPVTLSGNQTVSGGFVITGTTAGNQRYFFKSSVMDTQRTLSAASVTNFSDIDFRDIVATGGATWSGTRIGDAGNNSGITFTTPKTVYWNNTAGGFVNWSSNSWALTNGGAVTQTAFPLPQDTTIVTSGTSSGVKFDFVYNVGNTTISNGGVQVASTAYFLGDLIIPTLGNGGDMRLGGTVYFYNRTGATQTFSVRTYTTGSTMQWNSPTIIDTNGTVQFSNMSYGSLNTPYNKQFVCQTGAYISHVRGTLLLNDTIMTIPYYDSSFSGNTRVLNLGTATTTFSYGTDTTKGFVVQTSGYTLTASTSTVAFSGTTFGLISDGNLTFNNLSITNMSGITTKLIASKSYANSESTLSNISISANNMTIAANATSFSNSWLQLSGISGITLSGTMTFTSGNVATQRVTLVSLDTPTTISAATLGTMTDVDFSGITAAGTSAPWTGTRIGNAGRNSGITFDTPKNVYWANGTGTFNWYSLGWTTTLGGSAIANLIPLAQDTVIISDTQPSGTITFNILNNFALATISFAGRTTAVTMSTANNMLYPGNISFFSSLTWSGTGTLYLTGDSTQTVNTSSKTLTQAVRIAANGSVQLSAAVTISNASGITLTDGDLNLNNFTLTTPLLVLNTPLTKSITYGSTGAIAVNGNAATVVSIPSSVNNSVTSSGTSAINLTYSGATGTRTIDTSGISSSASAMNINVTAGTDILSIGTSTTNSGIMNLNTQGFAGTWVHQSALNLYGSMTVGTGVATIQDVSTNYVGTTTNNLTTNGKTLRGVFNINSNGGSFVLQDNLTLTQFGGGAISYLKLSQGTLNANDKNVTIDRFISTGSSSRTLSMGAGTWTITAVDDSATSTKTWDMNSSGLTTASSTSSVTFTGTGTRTFNGGSQQFNNVNVGGSGTFTVTGQNIFNTFSNSVQPITIIFAGNTAQSFTNFNLNGTAGNLVTIGSSTAVPATLYKASAWNVGTHSVNGGSNTGLSFTSGSNDYLNISNITGTGTAPLTPAIRLAGGMTLSGGYSITF